MSVISSLRTESGFYVLVSETLDWDSADAFAKNAYSVSSEGVINANLAAITTDAEQEGIKSWVLEIYANNGALFPIVSDGGGIPYVWLGGSDAALEGSFNWTSGETFGYTNWGNGSLFNTNPNFSSEPDNFNNQDSLAIALKSYPSGSVGTTGYGSAGQWNDIDSSNQIPSIIEFGASETRISINNLFYAFDIDGNAGTTAKVLGAFLGASGVDRSDLVSIGLELLDGGMTYEQLLQAALDTTFGSSPSGETLVNHFYNALTGEETPSSILNEYAPLINNGSLSAVSLAMQVAEYDLNLQNINLLGLAESGLQYS